MYNETNFSNQETNPNCIMLCPVLEIDRIATIHGAPSADQDLERHRIQSLKCEGTKIDLNRQLVVKCPLFNVEVKL